MAAAYATFASGGIYAKPTGITKVILPDGKSDTAVDWAKPQTKRVLQPGRCLEGQQRPAPERALRDGLRLLRRHPPERGQDRNDRGSRRRLVRRLHAGLSRRSSGWATRAARSRCSTSTATRSPARRSVCRSGTRTWRRPRRGKPARDFLTPDHLPVYMPFTRGDYGYSLRSSPVDDHHHDHDDDRRRPPRPTTTPTPPTTDSRPSDWPARVPPSEAAAVSSRPWRDLLTIDEALALVLGRVQPLEAEDVPTEAAAGRVLAEPARAAVDLPPFASSAMDGFAVRRADLPGTLPVVARSRRRATRAAGLGRARRWRSRPAASCRRAPTPSSRSKLRRGPDGDTVVIPDNVDGERPHPPAGG